MMDKKPHIKPYLYGMFAGFGAISLSILFFFLIYRFENHHIKEVTHEYSRMERSQNETEKGEKTTVTPQETAE